LISGGEVDVVALSLGSDCGGYTTSAPDLRLNLVDDFDLLRIFFVADEEQDATMIINDPNGNWFCNDDFSDRNPMVELTNAESGQYDIWVGSYSADKYIVGALYVTEMNYGPDNLPEGMPSDGGDELDLSLEPAFGSADLESGFQPDPHEVALISGGTVDVAAELGAECGGYAASAPDYRINLANDSDLLRIFFVANEEKDSTLIVNGPSGDWYCNDDFVGYDPMVELQNAESGQYDIWVGSYSDDDFIVGTLYITEMDYDPGNLP
jgi:serine protease Do